jgi:hypothetical protein
MRADTERRRECSDYAAVGRGAKSTFVAGGKGLTDAAERGALKPWGGLSVSGG